MQSHNSNYMEKYFEKFGFIKDPYERLNPYRIDECFLEWDRPDLISAKKDLERFFEDILNGKRVGLRIFGQTGSGKTWLTKIINKVLSGKTNTLKNPIVFIYTLIPSVEPSFSILYQIAIDYFLNNNLKNISKYVETTFGNLTFDNWKKIINHDELAHALAWLSSGASYPELSKKWIRGERLSSTELGSLKFTYSIDGDYTRLTILKELISNLSKNYAPVVFVVDELENTPPKISSAIGDSLRELLDDFSENFALIASFTAEKEDEWYEIGYSEQLSRRFDYLIRLDGLASEHIAEFLRMHHRLYLDPSKTNVDALAPFTEDALSHILQLMRPEYHYPGFFLPNCGKLVREAYEQKVSKIDSNFVDENKQILRDV